MNIKSLKQEVLEKVDGLDIFSKYVGKEIRLGKAIRSPLREGDKSPSFNIYRNPQGRVLFKDFAGEEGDALKFVQLLFGCTFSEAVQIVAADFGIAEPKDHIRKKQPVRTLNIDSYYKKPKAEFDYEKRSLEPSDVSYWMQYGIDIDTMNEYKTSACSYFKTGGLLVHSIPEDPVFVYEYESGSVRFYRPLSKDKKLKQIGNANSDDIFGYEQAHKLAMSKRIKRLNVLCICAGQKDVMSLVSNASIAAVCLNSESSHLKMGQYLKLKEIADEICLVYDNDKTGKANSEKLKAEYPDLVIIDISKVTELKDVSDYYKNLWDIVGADMLQVLIKQSIKLK
jgi:hypothetical protein